jgi:hypothetical protein
MWRQVCRQRSLAGRRPLLLHQALPHLGWLLQFCGLGCSFSMAPSRGQPCSSRLLSCRCRCALLWLHAAPQAQHVLRLPVPAAVYCKHRGPNSSSCSAANRAALNRQARCQHALAAAEWTRTWQCCPQSCQGSATPSAESASHPAALPGWWWLAPGFERWMPVGWGREGTRQPLRISALASS